MIADVRQNKGFFAVTLGLVANIILAIIKTSVGIFAHSPALLADGINSTSDVAYYVVVGIFMWVSGKPPDDEHPYGHTQLESIGALVVGSFVITTAIAVFINSVDVMFDLLSGQSEGVKAAPIALSIAVISIVVKLLLAIYTARIGRQTNNAALLALAYDHRNDIYASAAAAIGITLGFFGYLWVDPFAGALVSLVILRTGVVILRESTANLMDTVPGKALNTQISALLDNIPQIEQIDEIQAHRFGPYLVINITICVDGSLTVVKGDQIASLVEQTISDNIDFVRRVHVHYHPFLEN